MVFPYSTQFLDYIRNFMRCRVNACREGWTTMLNFSQAADNNKQPILDVLAGYLTDPATVLEVGSGSGQHAIHIAAQLGHLTWQPTELDHAIAPLRANLAEAASANVAAPVTLDVRQHPWPVGTVDCVYTANTLHIMAWSMVVAFMRGAGQALDARGYLCVYGPFRYQGDFTTPSNARFDNWLRARDPERGIRDFEAVDALAAAEGLVLEADVVMPANNQLLVWRMARGQSG